MFTYMKTLQPLKWSRLSKIGSVSAVFVIFIILYTTRSPFDPLVYHSDLVPYADNLPIDSSSAQVLAKIRRESSLCMSCSKQKKALVLMVHTIGTGYDYNAEWSNLNYFLKYGVNTSSADYFFIIPGPSTLFSWPDHYSNETDSYGNPTVSFVNCPRRLPCDLCAHSMVLSSVLFSNPKHMSCYNTIILLNSGTRGPFHPPALLSSEFDWISYIKTYTVDKLFAVGSSYYWGLRPHVQTHFIAVPGCIAADLANLWSETCQEGFYHCVIHGEYTFLPFLSALGIPVYVTSQNLTLACYEDYVTNQPKLSWWENENPNFRDVDPVQAVFIKYGGGIYRNKWIPETVVKAVQQMPY